MNPVILIAEDVLVNRLLVKSYITNDFPNSKIFEAGNGEEAVNQVIAHNPEIIFMDLHMPIKNGYQAAMEIREYEKTNRCKSPSVIIALSADATAGVKEKCIINGMNDYLQKPFNTNDIRNVLTKYFSLSFKNQNQDTINLPNLPDEFVKNDLMDRLNGNTELFQKLAGIAIQQLDTDLTNLKASIIKEDLAAIKMNNHSIKGVGLNLYFSRLAELAKTVEREYNFDKDRLLALTEKMTLEFEIIKKELTRYD